MKVRGAPGSLLFSTLVISTLIAIGCGSPPSTDPPQHAATSAPEAQATSPLAPTETVRDVVLITVDTLRADALGFTGNPNASTPALDRLAAGGRTFVRGYAHSVMTLPSHANLLTGLYPYRHGVRNNGGFTLANDQPTAATRLREAGFATGAVIGAFPLEARFGLDRGFDLYDDDFTDQGSDQMFSYAQRGGDEVVARALSWWRGASDRRRFLWLHLFEPHAPYAPPGPLAEAFTDHPYLGEVAAVDRYLEPLLDVLRAESSVLVVFTSDHGEALGHHGELTHGIFAYQPTLRVPLVLAGSGIEPGRDARLARHIDILPTILAATGVESGAELPGRSLLAPSQLGTHSYFEALSGALDLGWAPLRGVIRDDRKFIDLPVPELYNLAADPNERQNLFADEPETAADLRGLLPAESIWPPAPDTISPEVTAQLRALGYLVGGAPLRDRYGPEDDPKRLIGLSRKLNRVARLTWRGQIDEAVPLAREIVADRPDMPLSYNYLATLLLRRGDSEEALEVLEQARERQVASREVLHQLAISLTRAGRPQEALEILEPLLAAEAESGGRVDSATLGDLAVALAAAGRRQEAEARLRAALKDDSDNARLWEGLSFVHLEGRRFERARQAARRALDLEPDRVSAWNNLGVALKNLGQPREAVQAWRRAVELDPVAWDTQFNLGLVAAELGQREVARQALEVFLAAAPPSRYAAEIQQAEEALRQLDS